MKRLGMAAMVLAMAAMFSGCGTTGEIYGIAKPAAKIAFLSAAKDQGLEGKVTGDDFDLVWNALETDKAIKARANELAQDAAIKARMDELVGQYVMDGAFVNPDEIAEAAPHIVSKIDDWYGGKDLSGAVLDPRFKLTVSSDGRIWSAAPSDWPDEYNDKGAMRMWICAAYQNEAGKWVGGKYEQARPEPHPRSYSNLDGYNGWVEPPDGTELHLWAVSRDFKRVSTEVTAIYK